MDRTFVQKLSIFIVIITQFFVESSRNERDTSNSSQPKILSQNGHLIFQTSDNYNITFQTSSRGSVNIGDDNLQSIVKLVKQNNADVNDLKSAVGNGDLANKISQIEGKLQNLTPTGEVLRQLNSINDRLDSLNYQFTSLSSQLEAVNTTIYQYIRRNNRNNNAHKNLYNTLQDDFADIKTKLQTDECASNPCKNGGTCVDQYDKFHCRCQPQWRGETCEEDVNECYTLAGTDLGCQHGGTCVNEPGGFRCDCTTNWHGVKCTVSHDDCSGSSNEALCGHGTCINQARAQPGQPKYKCICNDGWTTRGNDPACTVDKDECQADRYPCSLSPRVECRNFPGGFLCGSCPTGYTGDGHTCSDFNECEVNNGGCYAEVQCLNTVGSRSCGSCPPGYDGNGITCSRSTTCNRGALGCHTMAICIPRPGGITPWSCVCNASFTGTGVGPHGCQPISPGGGGGAGVTCANNPCLHGTCTSSGQSYVCSCNAGWVGSNCNTDINECNNNPCLNGGTCVNNAGSYTCNCMNSFTGNTCQDRRQICGGELTAESGSLSFPSDSSQTYPHGVSCAWVITTSPNKIITLSFNRFKLEAHGSCQFDFLQINDGPSASAHMLGKYCGSSLPNGGTLNSTAHQMYLWFKSDASVSLDGFSLHWTSDLPVCGGVRTGKDHGNVTSPGYPGNYPHRRDCVWLITVPLGKIIQFHFGYMALENHVNCSYDYLEIRDGLAERDPVLQKYCTSRSLAPLSTSGPYARLKFHSDDNNNDRGFLITYSALPNGPGCGGAMTDDSGIIQSPNYPNPYNKNALCIWTITLPANEVMVFNVTNMDLENHQNCQYDYIEVRAGSDENAPFVGRYCGTTLPPVLTAQSNQLWIKFKTDASNHGNGFRATWNLACGGVYTNPIGELRSPFFPNPYPHNIECIYTIIQPQGARISLTFLTFQVEASSEQGCTFDYLEVRNGGSATSPLIQRFCGSSVPGALVSTGHQMWMKFGSDGSVANHGFKAHYSINWDGGDNNEGGTSGGGTNTTVMSDCGGSLTQSSGMFTSPQYPGYYPNGVNCTWYITVDPGMVIRLTFNSFSMENHENCAYDYVEIYDNNTEVGVLGRFCGSSPPSVVTSTNNVLTIRLRTDSSVAREGFSASYVALNASTACGGELRDVSGILTSPNYPDNYPHSRTCEWMIVMPTRQNILLNITDISMENHPNCQYDYLEVRNGGFATSPLLGRVCGVRYEERIFRSHSNRMYIKFRSDGSGSAQGFQLYYDGTLSGCGGELTSPTGSFVSPNFPQPYGHRAECFWSITVSQGNRIRLNFVDFELERSRNCAYDYLLVRDNSMNGNILGKFCGNSTPPYVSSVSNKMWVKFRTDYDLNGRGFHLNYHTECNNRLTTHSGVIESISFPNFYPNNGDCTYIVVAGQGNTVNASFSHFETEYHGNCEYDYVEIRDGEDQNAPLIGRYCGSNVPQPIATTTQYMYVHFVTDAATTATGFRMEYIVNGCGGFLMTPSGVISSPGYPDAYPSEQQCIWQIQVELGSRIQLNITDFDMESHQNCNYDALEVFGGIDTTSPRLAKLCSPQTSVQVLTSTGNQMVLRFRSDRSRSGRGFTASYTTIPGGCGGLFSSRTGTIMSPNYPQHYPPHTDCLWMIVVPERRSVQLTFDDFDLERHDNCSYDYVAIFDGQTVNDTMLLKACNNSEPLPEKVTSTGNQMLIRMRSDASVSSSGFKASYKLGCGGVIDAEEDGDIYSPNWPGLYEKNNNCTWFIQTAHPDDRITLTLTHINIEEMRNCSHDYVQVLEGNDMSAPEIGMYCGTTVPSPITSQGNALVVRFVTDASDERTGFRVTYTKSLSTCGAEFTAEHGSFNSPGYPNTYPNDVECVWLIHTSPGNRVMLTFSMFDLETEDQCNNDFIEIREEGPGGTILGRYCGTEVPSNMTVGHNLWIKFRSNGNTTGPGFMAHYNSLYGGELTGNFGMLVSPLYPGSYPHNAHYVWRITSDVGTILRIGVMTLDLEMGGPACVNDYLLIQDGADSDSPILKRLCGQLLQSATNVFVPTGNQVRITFHSDYSSSGRGFELHWIAMSSGPPIHPQPTECGGQLVATQELQNLTSPGYPSLYPSSTTCIWNIRTASPNMKVWFNIADIHTERHDACYYDYVAVYAGTNADPENTQIAKLCGTMPNEEPIVSPGSVLSVKFKSDHSVQYTGFLANFKEVCGGLIQAENGIIESPGFPNSYSSSQNCSWTIKVLAGRTVEVQFETFNIETSTECRNDYIAFFNGESLASPPLGNGRYCGPRAPTIPVTGGNYLTINFVSDDNNSTNNGFKLRFREKPLACGGSLRLLDRSQVLNISSPNYPQNYPPNVECVWVVTAPANERIQMDFDGDISIEAHRNCTYDYVMVRDGGTINSPEIGRYCGRRPQPDTILSSQNVMFIRFRTDTSSQSSGFSLNLKIAVCGGTVSGYNGSITTPNYPANYDNNLDCEWFVRAPTGHYLIFSFENFTLENGDGTDCTARDFVEIRDYNATGTTLGQFCGATTPSSVDTSDSFGYIRLKTNGQNNFRGFKLNFQASVEACGGELTTPVGTITSPNYPGLYPHARRCMWHIIVTPGRRITLTFNDFNLENHNHCQYDYVTIYNGILDNSPPLSDPLCGSTIPGALESSGNTMAVYFSTDGSQSAGGFSASYSSNNPQVCGGNFQAARNELKTLSSPGFGNNTSYESRQQCIWVISKSDQRPGSITVRFTSFSVEMQGECLYDHVEIREGPDATGALVGRYCGNDTIPPYIASPYPSLWVLFVTDSLVNDDGFELSYKVSDCGGILTSSSGIITSPNYPGLYPHSSSCAWQIKAPEGYQIKIEFLTLNIEAHALCKYDYLEVFNGGLPSSPSIGRFCDTNEPSNFTSQSNQLRLEFHTDTTSSAGGFRVKYTFIAQGCGGLFHNDAGSISSPNWPQLYPQNTECIWELNVQPGYHIETEFVPPFDLQIPETPGQCVKDYVEITAVPAVGDSYTARYCGNTLPQPESDMTVQPNKLKVKFKSDSTVARNGFSMNYSASCGAVYRPTILYPEGEIRSPGYPNSYSANLHCNYTIMADPDTFIVLEFSPELFRIEGQRDKSILNNPFSHYVNGNGSSNTAIDSSFSRKLRTMQVGSTSEVSELAWNSYYPNISMPTTPGFRCQYDYVAVYSGNSSSGRILAKLCGYTVPLPVVSQGSMHIEFVTDYYLNENGWKATFRALECGGNYTGPSGEIKTPTHPLKYHHRADCSWLITVDEDKIVELKFTQFDLEAHSNCNYDSVSIYDGVDVNSTLIGKYCGNVPPATIKSTGNQILVVFKTDASVAKTGFVAAYRAGFGPAQGCGGILNATSGNISSLDLDGNGEYEPNLECIWQIIVPDDKIISVTPGRFQLEQGNCLRFDYLEIRDGLYSSDPAIGRYCGTNGPAPFKTSANHMYVKFVTDDNTNRLGFSLTYTVENKTCGGTITVDNETPETLTSPNYPSPYPHNIKCRWILVAPSLKQIELNVTDLQIEQTPDCTYDFLELRDSPMGIYGSSGHYCGEPGMISFRSVGNIVHLNMQSDASNTGRGFSIDYQLASCNRTYSLPNGRIVSPGWPKKYPDRQNCEMLVMVPEGNYLSLFFNSFRLETHTECQYDYLQVFNGSTTENNHIAKVCGSTLPNPIFISGNTALLKFVSDHSVSFGGFDITYTSSPDGCGGNLTALNGSFTNPGYPGVPSEAKECKWLIMAPARHVITLRFTSLAINDSRGCDNHYVAVFDGDDTSDRRVGKYCGADKPADYMSSSNYLLVVYKSPTAALGIGFRIQYSS